MQTIYPELKGSKALPQLVTRVTDYMHTHIPKLMKATVA